MAVQESARNINLRCNLMVNNNYDDTQSYHYIVKAIVEGRDANFIRGLMERWYLYLHRAGGSQGTAASFAVNMKNGLVNGGGYEFLDDKGNTPLFWAAYYGRSDILRILVNEYKFSVDRQNFNGDSALHFAIKGDSLECAMNLVSLGANMNTSNLQSEYPLHMATCAGLNFVQFLLERGANPDCEDECGDTPLHWAIREDKFDCVELLLRYGADLHHQNEDDESPLMFAELFGTKHKLQSLESSAETNFTNGSSPMDVEEPEQQTPMYSFSADYGTSYQHNYTLFYNEYH